MNKTLENFQLEQGQIVNSKPKKPSGNKTYAIFWNIFLPTFVINVSGWGSRHTLALLGFWAFAISYAMRFNLSIAIVAMVGSKEQGHVSDANFTKHEPECSTYVDETVYHDNGHHHLVVNGGNSKRGEFDWNEKEQGVIMGSFFFGYVATQVLKIHENRCLWINNVHKNIYKWFSLPSFQEVS